MSKNKIIKNSEALRLTATFGDEFAVVNNSGFIHPSVELYPLTPKIVKPKSLKAVVMDMDGTTTTTEEICLHSLEYMVRKITGRMSSSKWEGLNHKKDYPHIIGNSTTKHVEYLVKMYKKHFTEEDFKKAFIFAIVWTLKNGKDKKRSEEVVINAKHLLGKDFLNDKLLRNILSFETNINKLSDKLYKKYSASFNSITFTNIVKASVDIYYQRYHEVLGKIQAGGGDMLDRELFSNPVKHLIEPMPGVAILISMIKGMLGEEIKYILPTLINELKDNVVIDKHELLKASKKLIALSKMFEKKPLKIAVVTSSIYYEADIVLSEVFKTVYKQAEQWNISSAKKKPILKMFENYRNVYDGFVTASDSNEIRLKPHRDLYSIALLQLDVAKKDFDKVMGLEDSESGTFAIRAAGIGFSVAVPFAQTAGHNLEAAAHIAYGGLPEIMIKHGLYLK
ncbi:MAG: hypothetical protein K8H86_14625 [Ignavibacteriaceae bacterium]|nr:hypothetical protein [Ignavibacteriaceae bacterium]